MTDDPHYISPQDAAVLTARWRANMPAGGLWGGGFERIAFDKLLAQPGCEGIRIYMGLETTPGQNNTSLWTFVLVGTDSGGNDMVSSSDRLRAGGEDADDGCGTEETPVPCPPACGDPSILNGGEPPP